MDKNLKHKALGILKRHIDICKFLMTDTYFNTKKYQQEYTSLKEKLDFAMDLELINEKEINNIEGFLYKEGYIAIFQPLSDKFDEGLNK